MFSLADWFFEVQNQRPIVPAQSASRAALTDCQSQLSEFISCVAKRSTVGIVTVVSRGWSWVDPKKEIEAFRLGEAAGYYTKSQIISMLGKDFDDNVEQIKAEKETLSEVGVQLDLDLDGSTAISGD